jgi:fluoroquinolone resistance protein
MDLISDKNKDFFNHKFINLQILDNVIKDKRFEGCIFTQCIFTDVSFENCQLIGCKFIDSVLTSLIPTDSNFSETSFQNCKVVGADWTKARELIEQKFTESQINYSNFTFVKTPKLVLINCVAKEVIFTETDLSESIFTDTDFESSRFFKTNLTKTDFRGAKNYYIDIKNNNLTKAKFSFPEALNLLKTLDIEVEY